jgi:hypothetical protein
MPRPRFFRGGKRPAPLPSIFRAPAGQEISLKTTPHAHLQAIAAGRGDEEAFLTVCFRILVGGSLTALADEEGEKALEKELDPAIIALVHIGARYERLRTFGVTGDELVALRAGLVLTDELHEAATRKQIDVMYAQVQKFVGGFAYTMKNLRRLRAHREDGTLVPAIELEVKPVALEQA